MQAYFRSVLDLLDLAPEAAASAANGGADLYSAAGALLDADVPLKLVAELRLLDFEVRKDAVRVFEAFLRLGGGSLGAEERLAEYLRARPQILALLLEACGDAEVSHFAAAMLRACAENREAAGLLLEAGAAEALLILGTREQSSDISFEAFAALRTLLTTQGEVVAAYLEAAFADFFDAYHALLQGAGYMAQRQALRLLGDLLLDSNFRRVMLAYVGNAQFFQIHVNLLRDPSKAIRVETFHIVKLFVGNPAKPLVVQAFLFRNRDRLIQLLEGLVRADDEVLAADLRSVAAIIGAIRPPATPRLLLGSHQAAAGQ